jgi:hypothetical protein
MGLGPHHPVASPALNTVRLGAMFIMELHLVWNRWSYSLSSALNLLGALT